MATGGLAIELEAEQPQLPNNLPVSESFEARHSRRHDNRVVPPLGRSWQIRKAVAFAPRLNQLASDVASNIERLRNCPALRDQAWEFIRGCKEQSFRQLLDLYLNRQLHTN